MASSKIITVKKFRKQEILSGNSVKLMRTTIEHTKPLYDQLVSEGVMDNLTIDIDDLEDFRKYIIFITNQWRLNQDFTYTIYSLKENHIMGQVSIYNISFNHHRGEIGIWLGKDNWNRGFAKDALDALMEYAFSELGINRLQCHIFTTNLSSIKLFETQGFEQEGLVREYVLKNNVYRDVFEYSFLQKDWMLRE